MTKDDLLVMLKSNLEIITEYMDDEAKAAKDLELSQYIESAVRFIEREGIALQTELTVDGESEEAVTDYRDISECMLIVMYASWLYEKRKASLSYGKEVGMPRMLRYNLNNRLFQEKLDG